MTANKRRKRRVRARVARTGETYTAALRYLRNMEENRMSEYQIRPAGLTDTGEVRTINQDHLLAEGDVFVVADGMGGHQGGEVASHIAVEALREAFATDPTAAGLGAAVEAANRAVWEQGQADPSLSGMGTTIAAVALVAGTRADGAARLAVANVGDSRVYLLRGGSLTLLSRDHSVVAEMVRAGQLSEDEAEHHPRRNILTRAVGIQPDVEPHLIEAEPAPGDRVLLCSDGLFVEVPLPDITAMLVAESDPAAAAARLVAQAKANGGSDNVTAVVLDIARTGDDDVPGDAGDAVPMGGTGVDIDTTPTPTDR